MSCCATIVLSELHVVGLIVILFKDAHRSLRRQHRERVVALLSSPLGKHLSDFGVGDQLLTPSQTANTAARMST